MLLLTAFAVDDGAAYDLCFFDVPLPFSMESAAGR